VRSTMTMNVPDQVPSESQEDEGFEAGIVTQPRACGSGGP
jgi:hypothetical protein